MSSSYLAERLIPTPYPAGVAQDFQYAAADHGDGKTQESPTENALTDETKQRKGKKTHEETICRKRRQISPI